MEGAKNYRLLEENGELLGAERGKIE